MNKANFIVVSQSDTEIVIRDLGPWDKYPTITNDAEGVVARLAPTLGGRCLFYYDSDGQCDEISVHDGKFAGFRPGGPK